MTHSSTTKALLRSPELILLPALANTLIQTSCSRDAVAIALHPARWLRRHVGKEARDGARLILRDTPLLRGIAKHLVAVAKRFLADIPQQLPWPEKRRQQKRDAHRAGQTAISFAKLYRNIARDARQYLAERTKQGAGDNELLAIMVFVEALGCTRKTAAHRKPTPIRDFPKPTNKGVFMSHDAY